MQKATILTAILLNQHIVIFGTVMGLMAWSRVLNGTIVAEPNTWDGGLAINPELMNELMEIELK